MSVLGLLQKVGLQALAPQLDDRCFDDWWHRASGAADGLTFQGLNSLVVLGAWFLWKHRNQCIFDGASPNVAEVLRLASEEMQIWGMARARGLSSLT
uniref:Uncharacterized protein n=1 Tax=Arundo donax TaxID=35708 RepID=A0A0A9C7Z3_ARUDO